LRACSSIFGAGMYPEGKIARVDYRKPYFLPVMMQG
jgi:hypothetical protein